MTIEDVGKWLNAFQAVAVIVGVGVAIWQLREISHQTRLQAQTLQASQVAQSATMVVTLEDKMEAKYYRIISAVQDHDQKYPLLAPGGVFRDIEIEEYIGNFEDIGYLVEEKSISSPMAYSHFSYDIEKSMVQPRRAEDHRRRSKGRQERYRLDRPDLRAL